MPSEAPRFPGAVNPLGRSDGRIPPPAPVAGSVPEEGEDEGPVTVSPPTRGGRGVVAVLDSGPVVVAEPAAPGPVVVGEPAAVGLVVVAEPAASGPVVVDDPAALGPVVVAEPNPVDVPVWLSTVAADKVAAVAKTQIEYW